MFHPICYVLWVHWYSERSRKLNSISKFKITNTILVPNSKLLLNIATSLDSNFPWNHLSIISKEILMAWGVSHPTGWRHWRLGQDHARCVTQKNMRHLNYVIDCVICNIYSTLFSMYIRSNLSLHYCVLAYNISHTKMKPLITGVQKQRNIINIKSSILFTLLLHYYFCGASGNLQRSHTKTIQIVSLLLSVVKCVKII